MTKEKAQKKSKKLDSEPEEGVGRSSDASSEEARITPTSPIVDLHACGICYQLYNDSERLPKVLSCGHTNCFTCLSSWVKHSSSPFPVCAICRKITRKPVFMLPNNFQLLEVLRRMRLISLEANVPISKEPVSCFTVDTSSSDMAAVCEKIDEHMKDVASLLESQMERLSTNQEQQQSPSSAGCSSPLRVVEDSVAEFLQRWESTRKCLLSFSKPRLLSRECDLVTHIIELMYPNGLLGDIGISSYDNLNVSPSDEEGHRIIERNGSDSLPEQSFANFSPFESDSHETTLSASLSSSQDGDISGFEEQTVSPIFPHITTIDTYSYCTLCQCQLPRDLASHQTHVLGRRHQTNDAIERSTDGTTSGRGWSLNSNPSRHHTRRTLNGSNSSGQNSNSTHLRAAGRLRSENRTGRINSSDTSDWARYFPQQDNGIVGSDSTFWRSTNSHHFVPDGNDRSSGRTNQSDSNFEWHYGTNPTPDSTVPRSHTNTQRRQSDWVNTDRRSNQRPQSPGRSGPITIGRFARASHGRAGYRYPIHSSNDDTSTWTPHSDRLSTQDPSAWDHIGLPFPL